MQSASYLVNIDLWDASHLSQARLAHAYDLAISSSAFKLLALLRDCASRETASSRSSEGNGPVRVGIKPINA